MDIKKLTVILILLFIFIMGCSGNYGKIKTLSEGDSKAAEKELIDNWSGYDIRFKQTIIVFDPANDDKMILVGSYWGKVEDQETWNRFVKVNTDNGSNISPLIPVHPVTGVREIWSPDNQFYGYIIYQKRDSIVIKVIEEKKVSLYHIIGHYGGP